MSRTRRRSPRVAVITGTRADYGLLRSTMEAVRAHPKLKLQVVVTGMHLLRRFGYTVNTIVRDGFGIDARVPMQSGDDSGLDQAKGLARGVVGLAKALERLKSDVAVVLGDRIEAMAGALAAVTTGRIVAHVHGGDLAPGDFDDAMRHAVTKLSHVHFPVTAEAARRIIRMGESAHRVFCVGAPGLDRLRELRESEGHGWRRSGTALIVQHAIGRRVAVERRAMAATLAAVERSGLTRTIIYPNTDRGHSGVIDAIETHRRRSRPEAVRVFRSLDRDAYLRTLLMADVLVGNSSSGIIEAAAAGTPAVNIGPRQNGRQRDRGLVIDVDERVEGIVKAVRRALAKRPITRSSTLYGDGHAGERITAVLSCLPLDDNMRRKQNAY